MQGKILCNKLKVRNNEKDMANSVSKLKKRTKQNKNKSEYEKKREKRLKFITSSEK